MVCVEMRGFGLRNDTRASLWSLMKVGIGMLSHCTTECTLCILQVIGDLLGKECFCDLASQAAHSRIDGILPILDTINL